MATTSSVTDGLRRAAASTGLLAFVASPALRHSPHRAYRALRSLDPVHASPLGIWVLSRHGDVTAALRTPSFGSDEQKADLQALHLDPLERVGKILGRRPEQAGSARDALRQLMLFRDPPDHTRLRALVAKGFGPRRAESASHLVQEHVDEVIERAQSTRQMEVIAELAYPIPIRIICELLGVPSEDAPLFLRCAPIVAARLDPSPMRNAEVGDAADRATDMLTGYLNELIADRRRQPGPDLLSGLIQAEEQGDRLSHEELITTVMLLIMAGHETTANLIGNGLLALLRHPDELARLREDPDLDSSAVEELMRYDGPIQMVQRVTLERVEIGGVAIPPGRIVVALLPAANHDPAVFDEPGRLDLSRTPNPHLGFGGGAHFCIGASLARVEARIVIGTLVRRLPTLRLAGERPRWRPSFTIRGLRTLPLRW